MKENEYLLLIFKRLSGDITAFELSKLNEWLSQSPENERIANEYALIWEKSGTFNKQFSPNLEQDFSKVQARIQKESKPVLQLLTFNQKLIRVAAALAILTLSVWGYKQFNTDDYYNAVATAQQLEKQALILSDGSQLWLREGSSIQYPSSFAGKKERLVKLSGEAYFEVAHDPSHPFRVELEQGATVEVLGTQFNVCQAPDVTKVLVRSGKVMFSPDGNTKSPVLVANQKAVFDRKAGTLSVTNVATLNELSWQSRTLEFVNAPLSQVVLELGQYYHVKIALENPVLNNCPYSALLSDQSIKQVLDGLALTFQLKVINSGSGAYVLRGGQCR